MRKSFLVLLCLFAVSCSTLRKQRFYAQAGGVILGSAIGGMIGTKLSPNEASRDENAIIGGTVGAAAGALAGDKIADFFWKEDPENKKLNEMVIENRKNPEIPKVNYPKFIVAKKTVKIDVMNEDEIPLFLRGKMKKGKILIHELEESEEKTEDGRILYHEPHKAYEYVLE